MCSLSVGIPVLVHRIYCAVQDRAQSVNLNSERGKYVNKNEIRHMLAPQICIKAIPPQSNLDSHFIVMVNKIINEKYFHTVTFCV